MSGTRVIVVGLGAVGSAAAHHLAAMGCRVIGFDRWDPPHTHGSTHGETRITRATAWEGDQYVPLARRANDLWRSLSEPSGEPLASWCGGLFIGAAEEYHVAGSRGSAERCGLPFELLAADELRHRWPYLAVPDDVVGFVDPGAGVLFPERIVRRQLRGAAARGAEIRTDERVLGWAADGEGVRVTTVRGTVRADRLILCTGAWMDDVLRPLGVPLTAERNTLHWFESRAGGPAFDLTHAPVLLLGDGRGHATAAFPALGGAIKGAGHGGQARGDVEQVDRDIHVTDIAPVQALLRRYLPAHVGAHLRSATCVYTITPDGHFILDRHPEHPQIVLGSPCNGFGFKFASATGEILAALAVESPCPVDPAPWRLGR